MAIKSSAQAYLAAMRQGGGLGVPADMVGTAGNFPLFFRYLPGIKCSPNLSYQRYREGGGGRYATLNLKEGFTHDIEFPVFARAIPLGFLASASTGPSAMARNLQNLSGGNVSNGLYHPPLKKIAGGDSTLTTFLPTGSIAGMTVALGTNFTGTDKLAIGWGPTLEFVTATTFATPTFTAFSATKYPHVAGEPVRTVNCYTTVATANTTGASPLLVVSETGFVAADMLVIGGRSLAGFRGLNYGASEEKAAGTVAAGSIAFAGTLANQHAVGEWVYQADTAVTTTAVHGFEPMTALGGQLDYYTFERAVGTDIIERVQDSKMGGFGLSGEALKPFTIQAKAAGRYGKTRTSAQALTENYTNQDPSLDIPFRFPNASFHFKVGSSLNYFNRCRKFDLQLNNIQAMDVFTNAISRDEVPDLAADLELTAEFYFDNPAEYYEAYYGTGAPASGTSPSSNAVLGEVLMDLNISATERAMVWVPNGVWEGFPVEVDPDPKPIVIQTKFSPLKGNEPAYLLAVQNKYLTTY